MKQITLETPTHFYLLGCGDDVEVIDGESIEVATPEGFGGGRMAVQAGMILRLLQWDDRDGLEEIGIEVLASVPRVGLN